MKEDDARAVRLDHRGDLGLRSVGGPARCDVADVLVGVRVADHHLLLVADGSERRSIHRLVEQAADDRGRVGEPAARLEQWHDPQHGAFAAGAGEARLLHQQQHLEQVRGTFTARDDVGLHRVTVNP
jgi:hypothetical protein